MQPVEHVRIGRHVFPRYSHPLMRTMLSDEAYVREEINRQLQNPKLYTVVNEVVEKLLQQGVTGEVSEEETEMYLEEAFERLGTFFTEDSSNTIDPETSTAPPLSPIRHFLPVLSHKQSVASPKRRVRHVSAKMRGRRGKRNAVFRTQPHVNEVQTQKKDEKVDDNLALPALSILTKRDLLSRADDGVSSDGNGNSGSASLRKGGGDFFEQSGICYSSHLMCPQAQQKQQQRNSMQSQPSRCPERNWQNAVRVLIYSMISLRLEESSGLQLEEMDLRSEAQHLLRLQGARLTSLSDVAFSALDITLDGNSSVICRRRCNTPSLLQRSHDQKANKIADVPTTALRQRVMRTLARLKIDTGMGTSLLSKKGTSLYSHSWGMPNLPERRFLAGSSTELELPSETYRSRVLGSNARRC